MKRAIVKLVSVAMILLMLIGATSVAAIEVSLDYIDGEFCHPVEIKTIEEILENERKRVKHIVNLDAPMLIMLDWVYAPDNPLNREAFWNGTASVAERAEAFELSHKMFTENYADALREKGIEIHTVDEVALFARGISICKGDVNYDGRQNAKDIIAIQKIMLNPESASDLQMYLADCNNDSRVNAKDIIVTMKRMINPFAE